jgi:hypothetical protein
VSEIQAFKGGEGRADVEDQVGAENTVKRVKITG